MSKEIVPLSPDDKKLLTEIAVAMAQHEEEIARKWDDLFVKSRNGLKESDRAIKDFKEAVWLLLTSLSDGDFDAYFNRIDGKGVELARTKEQYENLILSFHLFEEATFPYLQRPFAERMKSVLTTLDHMYHNVIAILARAYFRGMEQEREKFINILAHDLKNPLTSIMGFAELLIEKNLEGTLSKEKEAVYLEMIKAGGVRILNLIDSALNYGKLKSGKLDLSISKFNLIAVAREAALFLLPDANKSGISIYINGRELKDEVEPMTPVIVMGDMGLILRAVGNYLSNAVKYAQSRVKITIQERADDVLISVEDDGPGIPGNEISYIFEDYYMAKGGKPGTGLGLPSVRLIASLHNAKAWVESEEGQGSIFYLRLPRIQGA